MADAEIEGERESALTGFLEARIRQGYLIETRTDTHAVIVPGRWLTVKQAINPFERTSGRQVISVDDQAVVTMGPAEPLRF